MTFDETENPLIPLFSADQLKVVQAENERLRAALKHESDYRQQAVAEATRLRAALKTICDNDCAARGCDVYQIARAALGLEQGADGAKP